MTTPPPLFDRDFYRRRRARAHPRRDTGFPFATTAAEIAERVSTVRRRFPLALDLGWHGAHIAPNDQIGRIVRADSAPALLARAEGLRVCADEEVLPFKEGAFDLIVSTLALHWVNDLPGAFVQIRRALKPDGLFLAALFGGETLCELREVLLRAQSQTEEGASAHVPPFTDIRTGGDLLARGGLALPVADTDRHTRTYPDMMALLYELRRMGESNMLTLRQRRPLRRALLRRAGELYAEMFPAAEGGIRASFEILHLTGWAPAPSQPKPRPRGSAEMPLAQALEAIRQKRQD